METFRNDCYFTLACLTLIGAFSTCSSLTFLRREWIREGTGFLNTVSATSFKTWTFHLLNLHMRTGCLHFLPLHVNPYRKDIQENT